MRSRFCGVIFRDPCSESAKRVTGALGRDDCMIVESPPAAADDPSSAKWNAVVLGIDADTLADGLERIVRLRTEAPGRPIVAAIQGLDAQQIHAVFSAGAFDVVSVDSGEPEIRARVGRAVELTRIAPLSDMRSAMAPRMKDFVGTSPAFVAIVARLPTLAGCEAGVLLLGETGTGKEVCAHAIHYLSARASKPLVALNCGALPTELLESELFGHMKGAFTMAYQARKGLVCEAEGGTLFLDDVDCLPLPAQAKLLRFLEQHEYRPVGSNALCHADVRVVAASNDKLPQLVARGAFRQDLYFRLSVLALKLPSLRERREDIVALAVHFADIFARQFGRDMMGFSRPALHKLMLHEWPGNVRELKHVIERAVLMAGGPTLEPADLSIDGEDERTPDEDDSFGVAKSRTVVTFERSYIEHVLARCEGNVSQAARVAKKNRRAFFELMRKHGIDAARFRAPSAAAERVAAPGQSSPRGRTQLS